MTFTSFEGEFIRLLADVVVQRSHFHTNNHCAKKKQQKKTGHLLYRHHHTFALNFFTSSLMLLSLQPPLSLFYFFSQVSIPAHEFIWGGKKSNKHNQYVSMSKC